MTAAQEEAIRDLVGMLREVDREKNPGTAYIGDDGKVRQAVVQALLGTPAEIVRLRIPAAALAVIDDLSMLDDSPLCSDGDPKSGVFDTCVMDVPDVLSMLEETIEQVEDDDEAAQGVAELTALIEALTAPDLTAKVDAARRAGHA